MTRRSRGRAAGLAAVLALSFVVTTSGPASAAPVTWSLATSPNLGLAGNELTGVSCTSPTNCTAVGYVVNSAGVRLALAETGSGSSWATNTIPSRGSRSNSLGGVSCADASHCIAVGYSMNSADVSQTLAEVWNGTTWTISSSPSPGAGGSELTGVSCADASHCIAVGYSQNAVGILQTLTEAWNGSSWSLKTSPSPSAADDVLNGVSCADASHCIAVGYGEDGVGTVQTLVESWDGTTWSVTPTPANGARVLEAVSCASTASCVAVGWSGGFTKRTLILNWNGTAWTTAPSPNRGTLSNTLSGVACTSAVSCIAVGSNLTTTLSQSLIETWDGANWIRTESANRGTIANTLDAISCATALSCVTTGASVSNLAKRTLVLTASAPTDTTAPTISLSTPADGAYYVVGQNTNASYRCADEPTGSGIASCTGTVANGSPIDTSASGAQSFSVTATDVAGNSSTTTANYTVVEPVSASSDPQPGGESATTDPGAGPTPDIPITSTVTSSDEGTLSIDQGAVTLVPPSGFTVLGMQIDVGAPPAAPDAPLVLTFDVDAAMLPSGTTPDELSLLKSGALLPACTGSTTLPAGVDACVTGQTDAPSGGGNARVTAIAATGGQWNIALGAAVSPSIRIANASTLEGNSGSSQLPFTISLSKPSALPVTINYATFNGTATSSSDYASASGTVTFSPGDSAEDVPITIFGDTQVEPSETFGVILSSPTGGTLATAIAQGSIIDDDSTVPDAPRSVYATPGDTSATVHWGAPLHDGGRPVAGYVVTPFIGGVAQPARIFTNPLRIQAITGLANGTTYTFEVAATNSRGTGQMSPASYGITVGAPVAPSVLAVGTSSKASLSWQPPVNNGGAVQSYAVTVYQNGVLQSSKSHTITCTQPCAPPRTWTVTGLTNEKEYTFRVAATNASGTGPRGSTTILVSATPQAPGTPPAPKATLISIGVSLDWDAPSNGTATITSYQITPYKNGVAQTPIDLPADATFTYVINITKDVPYRFTVAARNAAGLGSPSPKSNSVTPT